MPAYIEIKAISDKAKATCTPLNVARHNLRTIKAELLGREGDTINPSRCHLNKILRGPGKPLAVVELMDKVIADYGAVIKRKDQIKLFEIVVSPKQTVQNLDGFFEEAISWLVNWFNCPLVSAIVHLDESEPHMHLLFVPLREGRLQGDAVMGKRQDLARLQSGFQSQLGKKFNLSERVNYTKKERIAGARIISDKLRSGEPLSPDQWLQLDKALRQANNFDMLSSAFGFDAKQTPIGVANGTNKRTEITMQNPDPYQCVGVQSLALPDTQDKTTESTIAKHQSQQTINNSHGLGKMETRQAMPASRSAKMVIDEQALIHRLFIQPEWQGQENERRQQHSA